MEIVAEYLWQIIVALGGSVVTLGMAFVRWRRGERVGEDVVWPAVACIVIALLGVAIQERQRRVAAEEGAGRPLLVGMSDPAFLLPVTDAEKKYLGTDVLLRAEIINQGAPSIVTEYRLLVKTTHGQSALRPALLSGLLQHGDSLQQQALIALKVRPENDLGERTSRAIERGAMQTGWLRFMVREIPVEDLISASTLVLSFRDYLGQGYSVAVQGRTSLDMLSCPDGSVAQCYLPGMETEEARGRH